jgi:hypothetical protein
MFPIFTVQQQITIKVRRRRDAARQPRGEAEANSTEAMQCFDELLLAEN